MTDVILTSSALTLLMGVAAIFMTWGILRCLDKIAGFDFSQWLNHVAYNHPEAASRYFGFRFIGACLLVGQVLS